MRYEVVDPVERRRAYVGAIVGLPLFAAITIGTVWMAVTASGSWPSRAFIWATAVAMVVFVVALLIHNAGKGWRIDPLLVVDGDGLTLRTKWFSGYGEPQRMRLPWSEVVSVGFGPLVPIHRQSLEPRTDAARVYLDWRRRAGVRDDLALPRVGSYGPQAVLVVGVRASSVGQDAEFRRRRAEVLGVMRYLRGEGRGAQLAGVDEVVGALIDWQAEWAGQPQSVGVLLAVPDGAVDPRRLDAALRAAGVSSGLRLLDAGLYSVLDTPQDLARHLAAVLPGANRIEDRAR